MAKSFLNTMVIRIDPAIGNSYRHVLCHFGKPRASLEYAKSSMFDFRSSTRVFDVSNFLNERSRRGNSCSGATSRSFTVIMNTPIRKVA